MSNSSDFQLGKLIFSSAPFGVVVADQKGLIRETNPGVRKLLGMLEGELEGQHLLDIFHTLTLRKIAPNQVYTLSGELEVFDGFKGSASINNPAQHLSSDTYIVFPDNKHEGIIEYSYPGHPDKWLSLKINYTRLSDDFVYVVVILDMTDVHVKQMEVMSLNKSLEMKIHERTRELVDANETLEMALNEIQAMQESLIEERKISSLSSFVRNSAHIFNTPIGMLTTATSILADEVRDIERLLLSGSLKKNKLLRFLDESSEALRISESQISFFVRMMDSLKRFSFENVSMAAVNVNLKGFFEQRNDEIYFIDLLFEGPEDIDLVLPVGLMNLLVSEVSMNSFYHGYNSILHEKILVTATVDSNYVNISFIDFGKGIPLDILPKVFEPYTTTEKISNDKLGLGLTLVFSITTLFLHGTVQITSEPGQGCKIELVFPKLQKVCVDN